MAASSPLSNFLSFLLPTKPPPPPQPKAPPLQLHLPQSSPSVQSQTQKPRDGRVSLVAQEGHSASSSLSSVICPSLAYSNTLFFKSAYNVQVVVDDNEPEERLLNRFRREVMRAGVIQECKRRRFHENKQEEKKRKSREAAKRNRRRRGPPPRFSAQNKPEAPTNKRDVDDEDNWDLPEGDIPY
ncbi:Ribosomal protein [Trema orientale]|uniref:Ribosomal protein n=1 Tax=Trema orientale TaxID=63057 RepID=A0A2P5FC53_TREOI|nr:Ribosomal protein [Trema orientale]